MLGALCTSYGLFCQKKLTEVILEILSTTMFSKSSVSANLHDAISDLISTIIDHAGAKHHGKPLHFFQ
jgi:hypothetical protein